MCSDNIAVRSGQRRAIEAVVAAQLPEATDLGRQAEAERRLNAQVAAVLPTQAGVNRCRRHVYT
ncbi:hypothetical protein ABXV03_19295 [Streptomyces harbinensis]|uniref:hypothetical protein n=1 Tax=Streptomyces harbinensis TaxID=1176198 RepID=UPI0033945390